MDPGFQGPPQTHSESQILAASLNLPGTPTTPQPQPGGRPVAHLSVPLLETLLGSLMRASEREGRKPGFSSPSKSQPTAVPAPAAGDWGAERCSPTDGGREPAPRTSSPGAGVPSPLLLAGVRSGDQFSVLCLEL